MPRRPVGTTSAPGGLAVHRDRSYSYLADRLATGGGIVEPATSDDVNFSGLVVPFQLLSINVRCEARSWRWFEP